ncbi:MAG TPA: AgmX/PglI C-terminal domain-containing protein [Gemmatimonadaceae bacterium]|nr:AgmX/PglI C-terminal domain-containing protein [Gemmatimonadaceae bacterium]
MAESYSGGRTRDETTFTRAMRWEAFGEEGRALVGSWTISVVLGILWLLLVFFGPEVSKDIDLTPPDETVEITVTPQEAPPEPEPAPIAEAAAPAPEAPRRAAPPSRQRVGGGGGGPSAAEAAGAFGGGNPGGMIGDVAGALRGVDVNSGAGGAALGGGKRVLGTGMGGAGTRTPGAGGFGSGTGRAASGIGGVGTGGGGVGRAAVGVGPPRIVAPPVSGPARDVGELGSFVRGRQQQLQFCYQEFGLKVNPNLAGTVGVSVRLATSGAVTDADISSRTWSGPGASEVESCIRQKVRGWRFPSTERGSEGTYGFSFSFSR